ncbi:MAG: beta-lactamase family protein [bacterium]|nr:beta-lactamase family protein [bacterium]
MTQIRRTAILVGILAASVCALAWGDPTGQGRRPGMQAESDPSEDRLQTIVTQLQLDHDLAGLSVAVAEGDKEARVAVAGLADLERRVAVTAETGFFIGSVSKNLFATVALRLVDQGRLSLDDKLQSYVEWPRGDEITVRMLLSHTSGIPEYMTRDLFQPSADGGIPEFFRVSRGPRDLIAILPDREPTFPPGSEQSYSNTNGLLVGEVIRKVTGRPLSRAFAELLVEPLELSEMYLYGVATTGGGRARGYSGAGNWGSMDGNLVDCSTADEALPDGADGSVVACAGDLLRYHRALRNGDLLSETSWKAMRTSAPGFHNGLGYLMSEGKFGRVEGNLGKSMGHMAANVYYLDHDLYVTMLSNRSDAPLPLRSFLELWLAPTE